MIGPNITGNPAIDKDPISGTDEQGSSASFLASLLSLISLMNPVNTSDEITSFSGISSSSAVLIDHSEKSTMKTFSIHGEIPFSKQPEGLSFGLDSTDDDKPFCNPAAVEAFQNISTTTVEEEITGISSINIVPYPSEGKKSPNVPAELPRNNAEIAATIVKGIKTNQFEGDLTQNINKEKDAIDLSFKNIDMSASRQGLKGSEIIDDKTLLNSQVDSDSPSVTSIKGDKEDSTVSHVSESASHLYNSLKSFKDDFRVESRIMRKATTDQSNEAIAHAEKTHDSLYAQRQIDPSSTIVLKANNKPIQDERPLEPSKPVIAHLEMEHSHDLDLSTLKVTVQHDELGELDIKLILNKGIINGQIKTPELTTADLIIRNIPEIINSLIKDGLNVGNLFVSLRNSRSGRDNLDYGSNSGNSGGIFSRQTNDLCLIPSGSGYINIFV